ncbi:uncharacterized protein LOC102806679 [Saccoglossus kowalevskii]|uniref:RING-type E3 ubiquitin transferase BRCA1 n=1 Tax=Saccoglossus kowalevskii TaxID=10224 RepID=A0ABM0MM27_SACKO|nr:PREDICTED: breast cancer type 1 susceptibility protein homolog [Saccoglossus kowalevskii]
MAAVVRNEITLVQDALFRMRKNLECPICLDLLKDPVTTRCSHQFCRFCITEFFKGTSSAPCPLCKKSITKRSLTESCKINEIVNAVRGVVDAVKEDTGLECTPPHGPPIASQSSPRPHTEKVLQHNSKNSHQVSTFSSVGKSKKKNTRIAKRKKVTDDSVSVYADDDVGDSESNEVQTGNLITNTNISSSFPRQQLKKKGRARNTRNANTESRQLTDNSAKDLLLILDKMPLNGDQAGSHTDEPKQDSTCNVQTCHHFSTTASTATSCQNDPNKIEKENVILLPQSNDAKLTCDSDPYEFIASQRTPKKGKVKFVKKKGQNKVGTKRGKSISGEQPRKKHCVAVVVKNNAAQPGKKCIPETSSHGIDLNMDAPVDRSHNSEVTCENGTISRQITQTTNSVRVTKVLDDKSDLATDSAVEVEEIMNVIETDNKHIYRESDSIVDITDDMNEPCTRQTRKSHKKSSSKNNSTKHVAAAQTATEELCIKDTEKSRVFIKSYSNSKRHFRKKSAENERKKVEEEKTGKSDWELALELSQELNGEEGIPEKRVLRSCDNNKDLQQKKSTRHSNRGMTVQREREVMDDSSDENDNTNLNITMDLKEIETNRESRSRKRRSVNAVTTCSQFSENQGAINHIIKHTMLESDSELSEECQIEVIDSNNGEERLRNVEEQSKKSSLEKTIKLRRSRRGKAPTKDTTEMKQLSFNAMPLNQSQEICEDSANTSHAPQQDRTIRRVCQVNADISHVEHQDKDNNQVNAETSRSTCQFNAESSHRACQVNADTSHSTCQVNTDTSNSKCHVNADTSNSKCHVNADTSNSKCHVNADTSNSKCHVNADTSNSTCQVNADTSLSTCQVNADTSHSTCQVNADSSHSTCQVNADTSNSKCQVNADTSNSKCHVNADTSNSKCQVNEDTSQCASHVNTDSSDSACHQVNANTSGSTTESLEMTDDVEFAPVEEIHNTDTVKVTDNNKVTGSVCHKRSLRRKRIGGVERSEKKTEHLKISSKAHNTESKPGIILPAPVQLEEQNEVTGKQCKSEQSSDIVMLESVEVQDHEINEEMMNSSLDDDTDEIESAGEGIDKLKCSSEGDSDIDFIPCRKDLDDSLIARGKRSAKKLASGGSASLTKLVTMAAMEKNLLKICKSNQSFVKDGDETLEDDRSSLNNQRKKNIAMSVDSTPKLLRVPDSVEDDDSTVLTIKRRNRYSQGRSPRVNSITSRSSTPKSPHVNIHSNTCISQNHERLEQQRDDAADDLNSAELFSCKSGEDIDLNSAHGDNSTKIIQLSVGKTEVKTLGINTQKHQVLKSPVFDNVDNIPKVTESRIEEGNSSLDSIVPASFGASQNSSQLTQPIVVIKIIKSNHNKGFSSDCSEKGNDNIMNRTRSKLRRKKKSVSPKSTLQSGKSSVSVVDDSVVMESRPSPHKSAKSLESEDLSGENSVSLLQPISTGMKDKLGSGDYPGDEIQEQSSLPDLEKSNNAPATLGDGSTVELFTPPDTHVTTTGLDSTDNTKVDHGGVDNSESTTQENQKPLTIKNKEHIIKNRKAYQSQGRSIKQRCISYDGDEESGGDEEEIIPPTPPTVPVDITPKLKNKTINKKDSAFKRPSTRQSHLNSPTVDGLSDSKMKLSRTTRSRGTTKITEAQKSPVSFPVDEGELLMKSPNSTSDGADKKNENENQSILIEGRDPDGISASPNNAESKADTPDDSPGVLRKKKKRVARRIEDESDSEDDLLPCSPDDAMLLLSPFEIPGRNDQREKILKDGVQQFALHLGSCDETFHEEAREDYHSDSTQDSINSKHLTSASSILSSQGDLLSTQVRDEMKEELNEMEAEMAKIKACIAAKASRDINLQRNSDDEDCPMEVDTYDGKEIADHVHGDESDEDIYGSPMSPSPPPPVDVPQSAGEMPVMLQAVTKMVDELKSPAAYTAGSKRGLLKHVVGESGSNRRKLDQIGNLQTVENKSPNRCASLRDGSTSSSKSFYSPVIDGRLADSSVRSRVRDSYRNESSAEKTPAANCNWKPVVAKSEFSLVATGLTRQELKNVEYFAMETGSKVEARFSLNTTHVIVKTDVELVCERTLKYFFGIAARKWVVSYRWIQACTEAGKVVPEDLYEVRGDVINGRNHKGPFKARTTTRRLLLHNYEISCIGSFSGLTKDQLYWLLELCGAEKVNNPSMFSYNPNKRTIIIMQPDANDSAKSFNYNNFYKKYTALVVSREWILDSIAKYTVQPLSEYLLCDVPSNHIDDVINIDSDSE